MESVERSVDAAALSELLARIGLERLSPALEGRTLGQLMLLAEDRVRLLSWLKVLGVSALAERQQLANAVSKLKREMPQPCESPAGSHPVLHAHALVERYGRHCASIGLLVRADGTCHFVNEKPGDFYGSHTFSTGLQQPKLDGPIIAEVARLAPLVGRPVYVGFADEDPFVADPSNAFFREAAAVDEQKLSDFRQALGDDVAVLTTTFVRGAPSAPCVGLLPAFDSWAADDSATDEFVRRLRREPLLPGTPFAQRLDRAVWRGARTGGDPSTSLRGRVVEHCRGKPWADVAFVGDMHTRGLGGPDAVGKMPGELSREQQAGYKVVLALDGHTWASCWEWALASGSVVVYLGVWTLHLMAELEPWVHYVPCASVCQIEERVLWVLEHAEEAERIAQNAYSLFKRVATPAHSRRCVSAALADLCSA